MPCHSEEQIQTIVETIRKVGFSLPVVTNGENSIVSGQGRVEAARKLKLSSIPTIPLQYMTEQERRLLSIGLMRFARLGNWQPGSLEIDVRGLPNMRLNTEFKIDGGFCDARGNMSYPKGRRLAWLVNPHILCGFTNKAKWSVGGPADLVPEKSGPSQGALNGSAFTFLETGGASQTGVQPASAPPNPGCAQVVG
jgi:hypothetical protein